MATKQFASPSGRHEHSEIRFAVLLDDISDQSLDAGHNFCGWALRRVPLDAAEDVYKYIENYCISMWPDKQRRLPHTHSLTALEGGFTLSPITDPSQWRIGVLEPQSPTIDFDALSEALRTSNDDLCLELYWGSKNNLIASSPLHCVQTGIALNTLRSPKTIDYSDVSNIVELRQKLDHSRHTAIHRSMKIFREIDSTADGTDLKLLGYFAVLECLLSHKPAPADTIDTITRQLKRNLMLIDNQLRLLGQNLPISDFTEKPEQVVGKLYSLRSAIAHGDDHLSMLKWLSDRRPAKSDSVGFWLHSVLRRTVQGCLRFALRSPQLVTDLRG